MGLQGCSFIRYEYTLCIIMAIYACNWLFINIYFRSIFFYTSGTGEVLPTSYLQRIIMNTKQLQIYSTEKELWSG